MEVVSRRRACDMGAVAGREDRCGGTEKKRGVVAAEKYSLGLCVADLSKKNGSGRGLSISARARGSEKFDLPLAPVLPHVRLCFLSAHLIKIWCPTRTSGGSDFWFPALLPRAFHGTILWLSKSAFVY
jgi:hypothetical protein